MDLRLILAGVVIGGLMAAAARFGEQPTSSVSFPDPTPPASEQPREVDVPAPRDAPEPERPRERTRTPAPTPDPTPEPTRPPERDVGGQSPASEPARLRTANDLKRLYRVYNDRFFGGTLPDAAIKVREISTSAFAAKTITGEGAALFGFERTPAILMRRAFMAQPKRKVAATFLHEMTHVSTGDREGSHSPSFCREAQRVADAINEPGLRSDYIATILPTRCDVE